MGLQTLYKRMGRSKLEYCCPIWNPVKITEIQKLENVKRYFIRKINGCRELQYRDRLEQINLMSQQRCRERYSIVMLEDPYNHVPNDVGIEFKDTGLRQRFHL